MALGYVAALRNNQLDEIGPLIDAGAGDGVLVIYQGTRPATGGAPGTEVATLKFSAASMGAAAAGVVTAAAISDDGNATGGTADWFRVADSADGVTPGNTVFDGDVGTSGSDLNLNSVTIAGGSTVSVTSFVITAGNP